MMSATWFGPVLTLHLLCALTFGGAVIFEVLIFESLHRHFAPATMQAIEAAIVRRARHFMPWVVGTLFITGALLWRAHVPDTSVMLASSFGRLLAVKIALAGVVLALFVSALTLFHLGCMTPRRFTWLHRTVFACVVAIVVLAKAMYYA